MSIVIGIAIIFCVFFAGMIVLVCRKLACDASLPPESDWLQHVSPDRYRPMERLLDAAEYRRLEKNPAISRKMLRRIRSSRIRLFRQYLQCLSLDFNRVCKGLKLVAVHSAQDRPDLAALLIRQRVAFSLHMVMAEIRLTMHALGIGSVDTAQLVAAFDSMRLELNSLLQAQPAAAAA
jgi:hypothetical protein